MTVLNPPIKAIFVIAIYAITTFIKVIVHLCIKELFNNTKYGDIMKTEHILNKFTKWCDKNINVCDQHKRTDLKTFDKMIKQAYTELEHLTNGKSDCASFTCGIAAGIKIMTLPENE